MTRTFVELVGIYDADGGVRGELGYLVQHLLGRAECALCDVTHGGIRRKPDWDAMVAGLGVPVRLVHRNETDAAERAAAAATGLPVVIGRRVDGAHRTLLTPAELAAAGGSVEAFGVALRAALAHEEVTP